MEFADVSTQKSTLEKWRSEAHGGSACLLLVVCSDERIRQTGCVRRLTEASTLTGSVMEEQVIC